MLHASMQARFRSHSALEFSESDSEHHLNLSQSQTSVFVGEEEEVFVDSPSHFSNLERRGRFQALSGSSEVFTPRICSPEPTDTEESEIDKSRQNGMQVRNLFQIPAELRRRSNSTTENQSAEETLKPNQHPKLCKRRSSESDALKRTEEPAMVDDFRYGRKRAQSFHTSSDYFIYRSGKLTENAKKLSQEEIHSLEIDIFKPLDFFEILFERMKITDSKTSMD